VSNNLLKRQALAGCPFLCERLFSQDIERRLARLLLLIGVLEEEGAAGLSPQRFLSGQKNRRPISRAQSDGRPG